MALLAFFVWPKVARIAPGIGTRSTGSEYDCRSRKSHLPGKYRLDGRSILGQGRLFKPISRVVGQLSEMRAGKSVGAVAGRALSRWWPGERRIRCLGGTPLVTMMETADLRKAHDPSLLGRLDRTRLGRFFRQRQMTAAPMIILEKSVQMTGQTG
jgi:hypothetical protein